MSGLAPGTVAIKVILTETAASLEFRDRFDREARAISALDHPHICALYDVGHEGEVAYLMMQFSEGQNAMSRDSPPLRSDRNRCRRARGARRGGARRRR